MKSEDRTSWLQPRLSASAIATATKRNSKTASKKAGPREIGRVGSDEWAPAEFAKKVTVAMKIENRNRTSWLNPKLATIKEQPRKAPRKLGPRDYGRVPAIAQDE